MVEYNLEKYGSINPYLYIGLTLLGAAAMAGFVIWCLNGWAREMTWYAFLFAMWMMYPLRRGLSLIIIGLAERRNADGPNVSFRPLSRFFAAAAPALWLMALLSMGFLTPMKSISYGIWTCISLLFLCLAVSGSALSGYYNKKWISAVFIVIDFVILIIAAVLVT